MKANVTSLSAKASGSIDLADAIFGLEPRPDLIHRMVVYQLAKRQQGTHSALNRAAVNGSTKKIYRQKGSGGARHSTRKVNLFRGGGKAFGPVPRSHAISLPKKVRTMALKHALSAKVKDKNLIVLDDAAPKDGKTKSLLSSLAKLKLRSTLIISGAQVDENLARAAANIPQLDVLPVQGINVYDIMRRDTLVLTKQAVEALEARLK